MGIGTSSILTLTKGLPLQKSNHVDQAITQGGITCACCLSANLKCNKCVLFIKKNYNMYIPHVCETIQKICAKKQSKHFMCKSCHTALQMVNEKKHTFTQNSDNASGEYTPSSDEWTCTCCHSTSPYK